MPLRNKAITTLPTLAALKGYIIESANAPGYWRLIGDGGVAITTHLSANAFTSAEAMEFLEGLPDRPDGTSEQG
jgi:hypothetical protein